MFSFFKRLQRIKAINACNYKCVSDFSKTPEGRAQGEEDISTLEPMNNNANE
jgi:hypothetical protein